MTDKTNTKEWLAILAIFIVVIFGYFTTKAQPNFIDSVYKEIQKQNIKHPEIVLKQSIQETGWFNCTKCSWRYNNAFGFRYKDWVTKTNPKGYIVFDTWQESVAYYSRWQKRHYKGGNYYEFLNKRGYATDSKYISNVKSIVYEPTK
jgi:hypothetical protein